MSETTKPRIRINTHGLVTGANGRSFTGDSFLNYKANLGYGANNVASGGTYGFNPISRNPRMLEWAYRGSWIVRKVVDVVADDMTRAKIHVTSDDTPDNKKELEQYWSRMQIWTRLNQTIKWSRLYGGCLAVMMFDGHRFDQPLQVDAISQDQFKGLLVLDRWMVNPNYDELVTEYGVDFGTPVYYQTVTDGRAIPTLKIHHSRCIRIEGIELPYFQRQAENGWGISVIEPMFDRLLAYDSTTQGAAQLVYKAHLRTYYVDKLREMISAGGKAYQALIMQVNMIRMMQNNEGMSLFDSSDRFEAHQYSFGGLSDMLIQFGQQISGAADIPLTRMFGQAPAGLSATGESDMRNYYDMINAQQNARLRIGIETLRSVTYRSRFGKAPPTGETIAFTPLYQLSDPEKVGLASSLIQAVGQAFESQFMTRQEAMMEIKEWSNVTGVGGNISEESIEAAKEDEPPSLKSLVGGRLDNPIDELRFRHGLEANDDGDDAENTEQIGEDQSVGGDDGDGNEMQEEAHRQAVAGDRLTVTRDRSSLLDIGGLNVIVETAKGEARRGRGWTVTMPAHYGYISGTSSAEGPKEQMDCYVGPNQQSLRAFILHQHDPDTGEFDEHKVMLGFDDKQAAIDTYCEAFADGSGPARIGRVRAVSLPRLKTWLEDWSYGLPGTVSEPAMSG